MRVMLVAMALWVGGPVWASPASSEQSSEAVRNAMARFLGTWELDKDASDSLDPLLALRGAPWPVRAAAAALGRTMRISEQGQALLIEQETVLDSRRVTMLLDDTPREESTPKGDTIRVRHRFQDGALITVMELALDDGQPATATTTRRVTADGGRLLLEHQLQAQDGRQASAHEEYRRRGP